MRFVTAQFVKPEGFALHIDDAPHHCRAVTEQVGALLGEENVVTIQPVYPGNEDVPEQTHRASTPLEAFQFADELITTQL